MTQGFCQLFLQSSSEPESMFPVLGQPDVHLCWAFADLYVRQTCIGVTVMTLGFFQLFLQSSSEPESLFPVLGQPDVHQCWAFADMSERQACIGATVVTPGCCQLFLQSLKACFLSWANLLCTCVGHLQTCM